MVEERKFIFFGIGGGLSLLILYFLILSVANSFSHAISQFSQLWYWILILVSGFSVQAGLFAFVKEKQKMISGKTLAASGGISTGAMIACCLHHTTDVLPLMGLTVAAVFLTQYQVWFIILGILSNLVGITIMLEIIQKNNLAGEFLRKVLVYNMGQIKKVAIGASLILLAASFFLINNQVPPTAVVDLPSRTDSQGGISFKVTPLDFNINNQLKFKIEIDTHTGSLDFDLTKISVLDDGESNKYQPLNWDGPGPGGHHLSGTLSFPKLASQTKMIKLTIEDVYLRIFEWEL